MHTRPTLFSLLLMAAGTLLILAACGGAATTAAPTQPPATTAPIPPTQTAPAAPELVGDSIRGGKLYDNWMKELGAEVPADLHPIWKASTAGETTVEKSWRCVKCHGWDYNGDKGFVGVMADAGKDPNEILAILKGSTNPDHDFSAVMDDQALTDLALFVGNEVIDTTAIVADGKPVNGDAANGKTLFGDNCTDCHGPEALAINFHPDSEPEYPATIANEDPLELLGKLRFGQPGVPAMPSGIDNGWTEQEYADAIAYIATLPTASPVTEGGRMYDNWMKALGVTAPEGNQPLWATQTTNAATGADTWRCKECHGWDYLGKDGRYAEGSSHYTGFPGIFAAKDKTAEEILAAMTGATNPDHNFSSYFTADELDRLAAFIQQGILDKTPYINADKTVNGDPANGKTLFEATCKVCHGEDGKTIDFADGEEVEYVGTVAADNPWEFFNKASVGQPGAAMPAGLNLGWSLQDIADVLAYAQTLPQK